MIRYCVRCNKEFDFKIKSTEDLKNLVCPECGSKIDENSRRPKTAEELRNEATVENAVAVSLSVFATILYYCYITLSIIGIAGYFLKINIVLYAATALCLAIYVTRFFIGHNDFAKGVIVLPIGAAAGFFLLGNTLEGACVGILVVFAIRHLIRRIYFRIVRALVRWGKSL